MNNDNDYSNIIKMLASMSETMNSIYKQVDVKAISDALSMVGQAASEAAKPLLANQEYYALLIREIGNALRSINLPNIDKDGIRAGFNRWGNFGWAVLTRGFRFGFYQKCPSTQEECDDLAKEYFTEERIQDLIDLTKEQVEKTKDIEKADFEEAIEIFKSDHYKSAALVLFSLIDRALIKKQQIVKGERRPIGLKAGKKYLKSLINNTDENSKFTTLCILENLLSCHKVLFKDGNDFVKQPQVINRNFLDHGMYDKSVEKLDCIRIMLFYYNVLTVINRSN